MNQTCPNALAVFSLVLAGLLTSAASAKVSARVYLADEMTPLALADPNVPEIYRDIMVGTKLTIIISSDIAEDWDGALWLSQENWAKGTLSSRGYDEHSRNYRGSCLPAAGNHPAVSIRVNSSGLKFDLFSGPNAVAGEWFILDYGALNSGVCNIGLYAFSADAVPGVVSQELPPPPPFEADLIQVLCFHHVPSRDFNGDTLVNFVDYTCLAGLWGETVVSDPNAVVAPDLNADGRVDVRDIALFSEYWLERTEAVQPAPESDEMDSMP
jgi:hypothetical protein